MAGFLVAEDGPIAGLIIRLEERDEWTVGRDPDVCYQVLEDPMVSRKHVVFKQTDDGIVLENLSSTNPASVNGKPALEPTLLEDSDTVQIGNSFFHFTTKDPNETSSDTTNYQRDTSFEEKETLDSVHYEDEHNARWIAKVVSGPNTGAEFYIEKNKSYTVGKDPDVSDIVFQDLSVSRKHAKLVCDENGNLSLEDLGSSNKTLLNGEEIEKSSGISSQDLIALGTTSILVIDKEKSRETIISPPPAQFEKKEEQKEEEVATKEEEKNWKEMLIPKKHLILAGTICLLVFIGIIGVIGLFSSTKVELATEDTNKIIEETLKNFKGVEYTYNDKTGNLFLLGHVLKEVDHQELSYLLRSLKFLRNIEDNVVIDELVSESMNALLMKNPNWRGVSIIAPKPGHFIARGYVQNIDLASDLTDYLNVNFPYVDRLTNAVVVENTLQAEIQSILIDKGFVNVTFQLSNGELILAGRVSDKQEKEFEEIVAYLNNVQGIRLIKNFVIFSSANSSIIDISSKFKVTGSSKVGNMSEYVVINGKILSVGDLLDGMKITKIDNNEILLEKDGLKYKIQYNQQ